MQKIFVLGAGRVGSAIALDLCKNFPVFSVDREQSQLDLLSSSGKGIKTIKADLSSGDFTELLKPADLVVSAVPGHIGFNTLERIIKTGKNVVDISFFPQDPFMLNELAVQEGVKAVVDCGIAPGMANIILGRYNRIMDLKKYECLVGGLPEIRVWPWQYKAVFSPIDVIEEYIRPARIVSGGKLVTREALSDPETINFDETGTLESFNTDGLRTLIRTMNIPDMVEKTLRYPGTIEYLKVLRTAGFFSYDPVIVDDHPVRPIDLTAKLLFPQWKLEKGEKDITLMDIRMSGLDRDGNAQTVHYRLFDRFDEAENILSMARTTGYTCTAVARLMLAGRVGQQGIIPPEYIGESGENFSFILGYLKERGVIFRKSEITSR